MKIRNISSSSIQYIIIQNSEEGEKSFVDYILNPTNTIFFHLIKYPKDLMQLHDQETFVSLSKSYPLNPAINCLIFNNKPFDENVLFQYRDLLSLSLRTCVYLIDANCDNLDYIISSINKTKHSSWFFNLYNQEKPSKYTTHNNYFENNEDLLKQFYENFDSIKENLIELGEGYKEIEFKENCEELNTEYNFNPIENNYRVIRELKYKIWKNLNFALKVQLKIENRHHAFLETLKGVDEIHSEYNSKIGLNKINNKLPILIASFPFNIPLLKKIALAGRSKNKALSKAFLVEQNKDNYTFEFEAEDQDRSSIEGFLKYFLAPRLLILDGITFLHSTFTHSPTIRFPLIGNSVNRELAFFNPEHNFFNSPQSLRNKLKAIRSFGEGLKKKLIKKDIGNYIESRNGQILAISDLPIEWLFLNDVPLMLTHDICRIQESNPQGNLNNYSANNRFETNIPHDILEKTLIILSSDGKRNQDHEFKESYHAVELEEKSLNYQYRYCENISQVAQAVKETKPYLLIFDCHGNVDSKKNTSFIQIGKDRLYGEDIVKNNISAPIVFLSCCNTNPNFGYTRKLHDAFFQIGAITVTGTFQPITIKRGTLYYLRLLRLLNVGVNKKFFDNWLAFISHVIRTSIIHDFMIKSFDDLKRDLTNEETLRLSVIINEMMFFSKRREIFAKLISTGLEISDDIIIRIEDTECEMLMYTHYGRPDLITFS